MRIQRKWGPVCAAICCAASNEFPATADFLFAVDESASVQDKLILRKENVSIEWSYSEPGGNPTWEWLFDDGTTTTQLLACIDFNDPEFLIWNGSLNAEAESGEILFLAGDDGLGVLVSTGGVFVQYFEFDPDALLYVRLGVQEEPPELFPLKCVCWPPNANGACTIAQCDTSGSCGSGGVCTWRHVTMVH